MRTPPLGGESLAPRRASAPLRPPSASVRHGVVGGALVVGISERGVPGGVKAVDEAPAKTRSQSRPVARVGGDRGGVRWPRSEFVAVRRRGTARRRGHGSCQCRGCYAGNARPGRVTGMSSHRWAPSDARRRSRVRAGPKKNAPALRRNGASHAWWAARVQSNTADATRLLCSRPTDNRTSGWRHLTARQQTPVRLGGRERGRRRTRRVQA